MVLNDTVKGSILPRQLTKAVFAERIPFMSCNDAQDPGEIRDRPQLICGVL